MPSSPILERILQKSGTPELLEILTGKLSGSDLQSLLLEVFHQRSLTLSPVDLLKAYQNNRFTRPSRVAPEHLLELDQLALRLRGDFECIELSPLAPFGACSALATVHQNKVVSALRHTEAVSDPTNLMALEIAARRKALKQQPEQLAKPVKLMSSQRVTRAQFFDHPAFSAHFRLICLVSGGRDTGSFRFETESLREHLSFYLHILSDSKTLGYQPGPVIVRFSDFTGGKRIPVLEKEVATPLQNDFPKVHFTFREDVESGKGYYQNLRFNIELTATDGEVFPLIDGGDTGWSRQLLSDRKERMLISAIGTQLYAQLFRKES